MPDDHPISEDVSTLMARLEKRDAVLTEIILRSEKERAAVRFTLASLRNLRGQQGDHPAISTTKVISKYMETLQSGEVITIDDVLEFSESINWTSTAVNRRGSVSTGLSRLYAAGKLLKDDTRHDGYIVPGRSKRNA